MEDTYYVYIATCRNGMFYTGFTTNLKKRIAAHNAGNGGHFTRRNRPLQLVTFWTFSNKPDAIHMERYIKRLPPAKKLALAQTNGTVFPN